MNHIEENRRIWDERAGNNDKWSIPVTAEVMAPPNPVVRPMISPMAEPACLGAESSTTE